MMVWIGADGCLVNAAADTRLSFPRDDSYATLIDEAPKIFEMELTCSRLGGLDNGVYRSATFGLGYAGDTYIANSVVLAITPLLKRLVSTNHGDDAVPSLLQVSEWIRLFLKKYICSINATGNQSNPRMAELSVFGHCGISNSMVAFHLNPTINGQCLDVEISQLDTTDPNAILLLGKHKGEIKRRVTNDRAGLCSVTTEWDRVPREVLRKIIRNRCFDDIGGAIQLAFATPKKFSLCVPVLPDADPDASESWKYLGMYPFPELATVGPCSVSFGGAI
ncbi:hypothetical protein ACI2TH_20920 [Ralstonia nicotianae]